MKNLFVRFVREEEGQDIIEYTLLAAFISIVAYTLLGTIGNDVNTIYTTVGEATSSAAASAAAAAPSRVDIRAGKRAGRFGGPLVILETGSTAMMLILRLLIALSSHSLRRRVFTRFVGGEAGQDVVEYALLAAFIGVAGWLALSVIDDAVGSTYSSWLSTTVGAPSLWDPARQSPRDRDDFNDFFRVACRRRARGGGNRRGVRLAYPPHSQLADVRCSGSGPDCWMG